jgi:hypothetical protein
MKNKLYIFFFELEKFDNNLFFNLNKKIKYINNFNNYLYNKNNLNLIKYKLFLNAKKYLIYKSKKKNCIKLLEKFINYNKENFMFIFYNKNFYLPYKLKFIINYLKYKNNYIKKFNNLIINKKINFLILKFLILIKKKKCQL